MAKTKSLAPLSPMDRLVRTRAWIKENSKKPKTNIPVARLIAMATRKIKAQEHGQNVVVTGVRKYEPPVDDGTDECYGSTIIDPSNFSLVWIDTSRRKPTIDTVRVVVTAQGELRRKFKIAAFDEHHGR